MALSVVMTTVVTEKSWVVEFEVFRINLVSTQPTFDPHVLIGAWGFWFGVYIAQGLSKLTWQIDGLKIDPMIRVSFERLKPTRKRKIHQNE